MAFIPNDPLFTTQWHLLNSTPGEYDLNVVDVWDDYDGSGIRVVALDRGFDYTHSDYDNYRTDLDWDFEDGDSIALPDPDPDLTDDVQVDAHGTPVLGIIGAAQDGEGTVGITFGAEIIGYKTDWSRDEVEAAINMATTDNHDVITMSYGESENVFIPRDGLADAAENAAENGRDGKGLIIVKSAGNSRRDPDGFYREETTAEALENSRHTIVVAGVSDAGELPPVLWQNGDPEANNGANKSSSPGANILTTALYGREGNSVQTIDITGAQGYSSNDYTGFSGTSAAAPQVAGVIALILDANPNLGWRDVQDIIAYSSRHIGSEVGDQAEGEEQATQLDGSTWFWNAADNWNGGGLHYSNDYGFGLIDAKAAVRLAETWDTQKTSANEVNPARIDALDREVTIADGSTSGGSNYFSLRFDDGIIIENITLGISFIDVEDLADLEIYLTSPGGTRVQLIADTGGLEDWSGYWRFGSTAFRGESSEGTWRLQIRDDDNAETSPITIADIDLWTHGANETNDDLFIFTDEYAAYAGVDGHTTNFAGGAGHDVINAAAMDNWIIVDLQNGQGAIGGHVVTMSGIEEVFGGDNHDRIHDGAGANELWGGRGNDTLRDTNAGGSDAYHGNQGYDTFEVYSGIGADSFFGGAGRDRIDWSHSPENTATFDLVAGEARDANGNVEEMRSIRDLIGTAQGDTIIENGTANDIDGHGGNDMFIMTSNIRNDTFRGGAGRDTIDWSAATVNGATFDLSSGEARDTDGHVEQMEDFENLIGTNQADTITESAANNIINAGSGNDLVRVTSLIGGDSFTGGFGTDTINWSQSAQANGIYDLSGGTARFGFVSEVMFGFENFIGTDQSDRIIEGAGVNDIRASFGDDIVEVTTLIGNDTFHGGAGNDIVDWSASEQENGVYDLYNGTASSERLTETMASFETFIGTDQDDTVIEGNLTYAIDTRAGEDTVVARSPILSTDYDGGAGTDLIDWQNVLQVGGSYDLAAGTASGTNGVTVAMDEFENLIGTGFRDTIRGTSGDNDLQGMDGNDRIFGRGGADRIDGSDGDDALRGSGGADTLFGGYGDDDLRGGSGHDVLTDGDGADRLRGQNGNDIFDFIVDQFIDRILDYTDGSDQIRLAGLDFTDLTISDRASGDVLITYADDRLILRDSDDTLSAADLTASDFLFA